MGLDIDGSPFHQAGKQLGNKFVRLDDAGVSYFLFKNVSRLNKKLISALERVQEEADCMR